MFGAFCQIDRFTNARSNEVLLSPERNERELIDFNEVKYIDQGTVDDVVRWDLVFGFGDNYSEIDPNTDLCVANSATKNIFRSFCFEVFVLSSSC